MKKLAILLIIALAACDVDGTAPIDPGSPYDLTFRLNPSGDPNVPDGVLLGWQAPTNGRATAFDVYGRTGNSGWIRRATTTSNTFHDAGIPQNQYYVLAIDEAGQEMGQSEVVTVDLSIRPPAPANITSVSLNRAIHLSWSDNAVTAPNSDFDHYRVYSSAYNAAQNRCVEPWYFEGSTVADAFLAGNVPNGESRCYAVSAISIYGNESVWSNFRRDTPRMDARSAIVYTAEFKADSAAFVFHEETGNVFGLVGFPTRADADFRLTRDVDGKVWITPGRVGAAVRTYQSTTIPELSTIDRAPATGYAGTPLEAAPGFGYVFSLAETSGSHFGALRIQHVTPNYIIFDWAYQPGVGNPELAARMK